MLDEIRALAKLLRIQHGVFPLEMLKQAADAIHAMLLVVEAVGYYAAACELDGMSDCAVDEASDTLLERWKAFEAQGKPGKEPK